MLVTKPEHRKKTEELWGLPEGTLPAKPGYHTSDMFRALMRGDVKAMWIQTTNPWVSIPNLHRIDRKPGDGRFVVVSDIYPTPTTARARPFNSCPKTSPTSSCRASASRTSTATSRPPAAATW